MTDAERRAEHAQEEKEERTAAVKPEVLRIYADLVEKQLVNLVTGALVPSLQPEVYIAAAKALRMQADAAERDSEY